MARSCVGIIGYGRIGAEHAAWIAAAGLTVGPVYDPTPARRDLARSRNLTPVTDIAAVLTDPAVNAALVSTPTSMHFDHAMAALAAGKHVMVEKPLALDLAQARQMTDEARRRNRVLSVFQNRRWDIDYLTVKHAVASGALGQIINVESRLGQWASCVGPAAREWHPSWRNEAEYGGGGLYDWGSHFVDQLWQLLLPAKPVRVFAQLRHNVWSRDCDDFARVLLDFDNGAAGLVEINTTTTRPGPRWHLDGTQGSASSPHSLAFDTHTWAQLEFTPATTPATSHPLPNASPGLTEADLWRRFATACAGDGEPAVTAESVLVTMALLDAARQSARTGRAIEVTI